MGLESSTGFLNTKKRELVCVEKVQELLVSMDSTMLLIIGFVLLAIVILFIVVKMIKLALFVAILCLVVFLGVPMAENMKDTVSYDSETKSLVVQMEDGEYAVDVDTLKSVKIVDGKVEFEVNGGEVKSIEIPKYSTVLITKYLETQGIEVKQ